MKAMFSAASAVLFLGMLATFSFVSPAHGQQGQPFNSLQNQINALQAQINALGTGGGASGLLFAGWRSFPGTVTYSSDGALFWFDEASATVPIPRDGRLMSLAVYPQINGLTGPALFTVRLNGTDTALQVAIPAGSTSVNIVDPAVSVPVLAGDLVTLRVDASAAGGTEIRYRATWMYAE